MRTYTASWTVIGDTLGQAPTFGSDENPGRFLQINFRQSLNENNPNFRAKNKNGSVNQILANAGIIVSQHNEPNLKYC